MFEKITSVLQKKKKRPTPVYERKTHIPLFQQEEIHFFQKRRKKMMFFKNIVSLVGLIKNYKFFIFLWTLIFVLGISGFLFFGPVLKIKTILITKQDTITNIEQAYASVEYIRDKNILFVDFGDIASRIQKGQSSLQNIELERKLPQTLNIRLKSYPPFFQTEEHIVLSNGVLLEKEKSYDKNLAFLHIISQEKDTFGFGDVVSPGSIEKIETLIQEIKKNIPGFTSTSLQYFVEERELIMSDSQGSLYIFDLQADAGRQIEQLSIFQKEKPELFEKKYVYIDVRIPQKLFLCSYEEEYTCKRNLIRIYGEEVITNSETSVSQQ